MSARDLFEQIRAFVVECARLEADLQELRSMTEPKGQTFEVVAHGSVASDGSAAILRVVEKEVEYEGRQAICNTMIEEALEVLYGKDGQGGLAKARDSATADCICGYYLMGMSWREVADEITRPDSDDARHWCMMRAYRGLKYIDRIGITSLMKS